MKNSFLFPALFAATQFVLPSVSAAEADATAARDAEIIKRYDTNKDGKLDETEVAAVKEQMLTANQEKREVRLDRLKERRTEWIKEFDKDGDGKLNDDEKKTMETTLRARMEKNPRMMERLDTDKDGKLSDAEWAAAREKLFERIKDAKDGLQK